MSLYYDYSKYLKSKKINDDYKSHYFKRIINDDSSSSIPPDVNINVFSKLLEDRIIILSGEIDDYMSEIIKVNLLYLESIGDEDISIYINSGGGSVYAGIGLIDTMEFIKPDIITVNTGLAASMAATILCSGTKGKRKALKRSRTMIHQPLSYTGFAQASDIEIDAKHINSIKTELYEIISDKTGQPYDKVQKDGDRDYWMNSSEAKRYGMIDKILDKRK
jgi:ATP-dependent Clp protease protease subunit